MNNLMQMFGNMQNFQQQFANFQKQMGNVKGKFLDSLAMATMLY